VTLPNGKTRHLRLRAERGRDPHDRRARIYGSIVDVTDIERNRQELRAALDMRAALLVEANHRIKNSLQIAISMLRIEAGALAHEAPDQKLAVDRLRAVETRIRAVADAHSLLQFDDHITHMRIHDLLERLAETMRESAGLNADSLRFASSDAETSIENDFVVRLALIVSELLTNAIKFGCREDGDADIELHLARDGDRIRIDVTSVVASDKCGTPPIASTGFGSRLVMGFAQAMSGELRTRQANGRFVAQLCFPVPEPTLDAA
jgi:two-component sensor histidine kinase